MRDDTYVELNKHLVRVVWILAAEIRRVVIDLLICLTEEVIKSVSLNCSRAHLCFRDIVADSVRIGLVGLPFGDAWKVEATNALVSTH